MDSIWGNISAAELPCRKRAASSVVGVGAAPHSAEEIVKPASPIWNSRRRQ
jgi:hypothetical protein